MNTRDGRIYTPEEMEKMKALWAKVEERIYNELAGRLKAEVSRPNGGLEERFIKEMVVPPTERQLARKPPKIGRNELCPCGSGKKFKKCCLNSIK